MRDVVKTNVKREQNRKRKRRRRRHTSFYFFLVFLMVIGIGVLLSVTLLFNVKKIVVKGDVDYKNEDIINVSGISNGDNLVRLDSKKASDNILASMIYIESADIDKQYPGTLVINVSRCVSTAYVECEDGFLVVSAKGKILDKVKEMSEELLIIKGFEPVNETPGTYLQSADEQKDSIAKEFLEISGGEEKHKITAVDMTDKYDITIDYENRITFEMGNSNDISYKLNLAGTVLDELSDDKKGYMKMVGTNQISFRDKEDKERADNSNKIPIKEEDMPSTEATESTQPAEEEIPADDGYSEEEYSEADYYEEEYSEDEYYEEDYYEDGYSEEEYYEDGEYYE